MLKQLVNECRFTLTLETKSPLLIQEGRLKAEEQDEKNWKEIFIERGIIRKEDKESYPNAIFVALNTQQELEEAIRNQDYSRLKFYIPGSSLRGVIRAHAEKIVRTVSDNGKEPLCCNPFDTTENFRQISCSEWLKEAKAKNSISSKDAYKLSCVICRLFGNTHTASRIQVHDSEIVTGIQPGIRDGIGIDRFTGGVSTGANFKNQILEGYTFQSEIAVRNFELWQLGLLAYVLRDFEQELITVGSGKNKGFGRVKGTIEKVQLIYYRPNSNQLKGLGELCPPLAENYDFVSIALEPPENWPVNLGQPTPGLYWNQFETVVNQNNGGIVKNEVWKACAKVWNQAIKANRFKTIPALKAQTSP